MDSEIRRIIAIEVHRLRAGKCPIEVYSLGTGESFAIQPTADGFIDLTSGLAVQSSPGHVVLPGRQATIDLHLIGDIGFAGYDHSAKKAFSGRAGGGATVTVYDDRDNYFQYAVATETQPS